MGRQTVGIRFDAERRKWEVDKVYRGERLRQRCESHQEAEEWLIAACAQIDSHGPITKESKITFAQAAARYLEQELRTEKASLETETYLLAPVVKLIGDLPLNQVHDGTLKEFVDERLEDGVSHKSINLALGVVRHILNIAHKKWRVEVGRKGETRPLLAQVPQLTMLPLAGHQRDPRPITWQEQRRLLPALPAHLARMSLFILNCGVRESVVRNLRWEWELRIELDGELISVFEVPARFVKGDKMRMGSKKVRYIVCNSAAQSIVESMRGMHDEFVFVWRRERVKNKHLPAKMAYGPLKTGMCNTAWDTARVKAGLGDLHVHDLRHTVGMRLREANVSENTIAEVLWHVRGNITLHYSIAQVRELREALELIKDDSGRTNISLHTLARQSRASVVSRSEVAAQVPPESPQERKTA